MNLVILQKVDHWVDKIQIVSAVKKEINDYLFESVPYPTYGDGDIVVKIEIFFKHYL
jgi:type I restriction enzyme R subunit